MLGDELNNTKSCCLYACGNTFGERLTCCVQSEYNIAIMFVCVHIAGYRLFQTNITGEGPPLYTFVHLYIILMYIYQFFVV